MSVVQKMLGLQNI